MLCKFNKKYLPRPQVSIGRHKGDEYSHLCINDVSTDRGFPCFISIKNQCDKFEDECHAHGKPLLKHVHVLLDVPYLVDVTSGHMNGIMSANPYRTFSRFIFISNKSTFDVHCLHFRARETRTALKCRSSFKLLFIFCHFSLRSLVNCRQTYQRRTFEASKKAANASTLVS